ncbi:MAG: hypothetical protein DWQ37_01460 [Planctomycetota bacterium]|nr:MAG: hypothetical protein DWQ37_01460 [Planctomycetota bacterium]
MKTAIAGVALALMAVSTASAGEPAGISKNTLGNMGLGSMQTMSDTEGMTVRGKGTFAGVWGGSTAAWSGGQVSNNNYEAASSWAHKPAFAKGESLSFAGIIEATYLQDPTGSALNVQILGGVAGGSAWAKSY